MGKLQKLFSILTSILKNTLAITSTSNFLSIKIKFSKYPNVSEAALLEVFYALIRKVGFINESHIPKDIYQVAYELVKDVDSDDTPFVALNTYLNGYLWTGDIPLKDNLRAKGYKNVISTQDLLKMLEKTS